MNIFDKEYFPLHHFSYEVFVRCPKCSGLGKVTTVKEGYFYEKDKSAKFSCLECGHLSASVKEWLGYYVGYIGFDYKGKACGNCGSVFQKEFEITKTPYKSGMAECPVCHKEREYEINWYRYRGESPTDPFFGLDLYFQKQVKNGLLWVYNLEHLQYLRDYINATVRKRERVGLYSMIARLPDFITSSKNREAITKQLNNFEEEIRKSSANKAHKLNIG